MGPNHTSGRLEQQFSLTAASRGAWIIASMLWFPVLRPARWAAALARGLARSPVDNRWLIGRLVEIGGNRVDVDGLTFSLDNPLIRTRDKSTVCLGLHEASELALVHARLVAA